MRRLPTGPDGFYGLTDTRVWSPATSADVGIRFGSMSDARLLADARYRRTLVYIG
jgi:hypothetical protein